MAQAHYDDAGNARVDFVWGNMPMQPNVGRTDSYYSFGGGYNQGDNGWDSAEQYTSDTLNYQYTRYLNNGWIQQTIGTNHSMVTTGYSNYPGYIPNYAGDGDADLETVIPVITGLSKYAAEQALNKANLDYDWEWTSLYIAGLTTSADGSTGTAYLDDWNQLLEGLKKDDVLWFDWNDGSHGYSKNITVVSVDPVDTNSIKFKFTDGAFNYFGTEDVYAYDDSVIGNIYSGSEDTYNRVLTTDRPPAAGDIVNEGTGVYFYVLGD